MKKMAVLINGEFREFEIAVQSWKFMNEIDCDFYISTWSKCVQKHKKLGINIEEEITEERIRKILPNANILISNIFRMIKRTIYRVILAKEFGII